MRQRKFIVFLLMVCLLLVGCTTKYKTDLDKEYASYWKYALGDYQASYKTVTRDHDGGIGRDTYREYIFTFKDSNNNENFIYITNYFTNGSTFDDKLKSSIEGYLSADVDTELLKKKLSEQNIEAYQVYASCKIEQIDKSIKLSDDKKGVKISDLSFKTLKENNLNVLIELHIYTEEEYDFAEFVQQTIPFLSELKEGDLTIFNDINNMMFEVTMIPHCRGCKRQTIRLMSNGFSYTPVED